jgi:hypothetical protein
METDEFWHIIATARGDTTEQHSFDQALVALLAGRSKEEILEYEKCFEDLQEAVRRWDVWAAAYLIHGGCSDDSFMDFRAGLIALGREWYERAGAAPDSLAEHPQVIAAAGGGDADFLFYELVNYASSYAFERITGDVEDFYEAWEDYEEALGAEPPAADMGEDFDFDDSREMHRRLPRLAALFLPTSTA